MANLSFSFENPLRVRFGDEFFQSLPQEPGVYFFLDEEGQPLYIGKAESLRRRLSSYRAVKPGNAPEHVLEMIELAREIIWEKQPDGATALRREGELIRTVRPPFNIAGTEPIEFLYCGIKTLSEKTDAIDAIDFRLSHREFEKGFSTYGCFLHRGKTKAGFSALLRLLFVATCMKDRMHLPARLCRTSPLYIQRAEIPRHWRKPLHDFLSGKSLELLSLMTKTLLEKENIPPHLYAPLQRDLRTAKEFFVAGPETSAKILKASGLKRTWLTQKQMQKHAAELNHDFIERLKRQDAVLVVPS